MAIASRWILPLLVSLMVHQWNGKAMAKSVPKVQPAIDLFPTPDPSVPKTSLLQEPRVSASYSRRLLNFSFQEMSTRTAQSKPKSHWRRGILLASSSSSSVPPLGHVNNTSSQIQRLRDEVWVVPLIVLATLNLIVMAGFEAFVLVKMVNARPSRRHFFLGQMLLLGLFLSSLVSFAYVTPPNIISCTVVRLGVGLSYSFVFAALMVKAVFLISLNNGVYLPAAYHGLLLFFAVGVQVAIGVQWLVQRPPGLVFSRGPSGPVVSSCNTTFDEMLLSLVYVMFLLVFVTLLAIKSHGIRDNYREAMFIGLAIGCSLPIWVTWIVVALVLRNGYEEPSLAFGLIINSTLTFVIMFVPKGRQLAALGKEGLCFEDQDRDDHLSSISLPSLYTPSFYHFKPPVREPQSSAYKTSLTTDQASYPPHIPERTLRRHMYPAYSSHQYYDDTMYYSFMRTMTSNPNVHFVRNPMIY